MSTTRGYKIRSYVNGRSKKGDEYKNYALTVPNDIAEALPNGLTFVPILASRETHGVDGLLYVPQNQAASHVELPAWANEETVTTNGNSGKSKGK